MSAITVTASKVAAIFPLIAEIYDGVSGVVVTAGQAGYFSASTKKVVLSDSDAAGTAHCNGIALKAAGVGQGLSLLKKGHCAGIDVSGMSVGAKIYLSDAAGGLDTAAGTVSVVVGVVVPMPDDSLTKVAYIDAPWLT